MKSAFVLLLDNADAETLNHFCHTDFPGHGKQGEVHLVTVVNYFLGNGVNIFSYINNKPCSLSGSQTAHQEAKSYSLHLLPLPLAPERADARVRLTSGAEPVLE